jgi:hypothetical protein
MHPPALRSDQVVANTQLHAPDVVELVSGVDALYLSGHAYLPKAFLARLEDTRHFADQVSMPVPFELGPLTFGLAPHGWGKYRFCLDHECGRIGFTSSTRLPAARIQPRAEFLHALGPAGTVRHFDELLRPLMDRLVFTVARIDLFCDVQGLVLRGDDRSAFLCRGDASTTYEAGHVCTGFAFGSRRTQRISARIYDKTAEMATKGTDWWEAVWGERHHTDAILAAVPSLWRYCTGDWLTLRTPGPDSNSSRWPVAPPWRVVQGATLAHNGTELTWIRRRKRASSFRRLMPGLVGYLVSFAALSGTFTVADTLEALTAHLAEDEIVRRRTFTERVRRRRAEGGFR